MTQGTSLGRISYEACPLCGSRSTAEHRTEDCTGHTLYRPSLPPQIRWMRCQDCKHIFTDGYFSPEAVSDIFSATNPHQETGFNLENWRNIYARTIEKILPYAASGIWLDVGFGSGVLLFTAQEFGFTPVGLDLRGQIVDWMCGLGVNAFAKDITEFALDRPCAVISMADVLEHMPFPKQGLAAAHRLLGDDGILLVSMPNIESMPWRAADALDNNPYWKEIEHYHNFSRNRLYALLNECGFTPLQYGVSERYRAGMEVIARKTAT